MNILLALEAGSWREQLFPERLMQRLEAQGTLRINGYGRAMTERELAAELEDVEVCITFAWSGCAAFTRDVLDHAKSLKLIVTPGGSVASFATEDVYARGIKVCSANRVMARYVAEGALAYMLSSLREIVSRNAAIRNGQWNNAPIHSLIGAKVGLIGLGTVGRFLLDFLRPFDVAVTLYDPYLAPESMESYTNVTIVSSLEAALLDQDVVSLHASKTAETYHMINREKLALLKDGALLINTARGALIDEEALAIELQSGRIHAVLDVFETEPLPAGSKLRQAEQAIFMPHVAGMIKLELLALSMLDEIDRYRQGRPLQHEIPVGQFRLMTREA
jgi:phosphoglycerate dehydrogenase-like enzyme